MVIISRLTFNYSKVKERKLRSQVFESSAIGGEKNKISYCFQRDSLRSTLHMSQTKLHLHIRKSRGRVSSLIGTERERESVCVFNFNVKTIKKVH